MTGLTAEQQLALEKLLEDYKAAANEHVPGYKGGRMSKKIAIALILGGWRRRTHAESSGDEAAYD